jgi:phosphate transport system substrate-binding protein
VTTPRTARRRRLATAAGLLALALCQIGVPRRAEAVTIKGSDTMVILAQRWIENYQRANPSVVVQLTGGGSETGIAALINGTTDIAAASRPMTPGEVAQVESHHARHVAQTPVALDALAIVVNEANPVDAISLDDLAKVFRGEIHSWKELGGDDLPIAIYGRDHTSGSYAFFRHRVLHDEDFSLDALSLVGTASIVDSVSKDRNGIGYGGIAYVAGAKNLRLKERPDGPAVAATLANAHDGSYALARQLWFHVAEPRDDDTARFVAWVLSEAGQRIVSEVGFYPLATSGGAMPARAGTDGAAPQGGS